MRFLSLPYSQKTDSKVLLFGSREEGKERKKGRRKKKTKRKETKRTKRNERKGEGPGDRCEWRGCLPCGGERRFRRAATEKCASSGRRAHRAEGASTAMTAAQECEGDNVVICSSDDADFGGRREDGGVDPEEARGTGDGDGDFQRCIRTWSKVRGEKIEASCFCSATHSQP